MYARKRVLSWVMTGFMTAASMWLGTAPVHAATVWHGLDGYLITDQLAQAFNLPAAGLLIQRVAHGSPAERLGLRGGRYGIAIGDEQLLIGGDVIIAVQGTALAEPDAYERVRRRLLEVRASGDVMRLSVMRDGALTELTASLEP